MSAYHVVVLVVATVGAVVPVGLSAVCSRPSRSVTVMGWWVGAGWYVGCSMGVVSMLDARLYLVQMVPVLCQAVLVVQSA